MLQIKKYINSHLCSIGRSLSLDWVSFVLLYERWDEMIFLPLNRIAFRDQVLWTFFLQSFFFLFIFCSHTRIGEKNVIWKIKFHTKWKRARRRLFYSHSVKDRRYAMYIIMLWIRLCISVFAQHIAVKWKPSLLRLSQMPSSTPSVSCISFLLLTHLLKIMRRIFISK